MATVNLSGSSIFDIGKGFLDRNGWTVVGHDAISRVVQRIKTERRNIQDASAKPYSGRGPIYIPLTGKGRTKAGLKGREVITRANLKRVRDKYFGASQAAGFLNVISDVKFRAPTQPGEVTPSGKSIKFKNYSEYKKFLGKSGDRDLELSGKMLNDIDITAIGDNYVNINFRTQQQADKMSGNIRIDDEWGFSPRDKEEILNLIESEGLRRIQEQWRSNG